MPRAKKKHAGGRPTQALTQQHVLVTGPAILLAAVEHRAGQDGVSVREAWRRAARVWLGWHEEAEVSGED